MTLPRVALVIPVALLIVPVSARADVVLQWNQVLISTIPAANPFVGTRVAAIAHLAMFEAVNAITGDYEPYLGTITAPPGASPEAAAASAAHAVLLNFFPAASAALDAALAASLAEVPDGDAEADGVAVGKAAAAAMLTERVGDGSSPATIYTPESTGPGEWTLYGACTGGVFFHWSGVKPFGLESTAQFRSPQPPLLGSGRYANDFDEVRILGDAGSLVRTADGTDLARLYAVLLPPELWNRVARQLAEAAGPSLSSNARTFALLNVAMADGLIAVFEAKYFYRTWRPITAIPAAATDGNAKTVADPGFRTLINTPCYPAYPSGHSAVSNAARQILLKIWGNGSHAIVLDQASVTGVERFYTNLKQITDDIDDARVLAGIHFRFDQEAASHMGTQVGNYIFENHLREE